VGALSGSYAFPMITNRLLGAVATVLAAATLAACSTAVAGTAGTPVASSGGGDPGATLWTQYGESPVHDVVDVASLGRKLVWLDTNGKVWTGEPTTAGLTPEAVPGLPDGIVDVDGRAGRDGEFTAAAVAKDGSVWMWGRVVGVDGSGAPMDRVTTTPVRIDGVRDARSVEVGAAVTFAVTDAGTVWSWGRSGDYTMLGRKVADTSVPQGPAQVTGPADVVRVSAGFPAVVALTKDGTVWGWGSNNYETLAPTDGNQPEIPRLLPELRGIAVIESGEFGAYAVSRGGTVLAWGDGTSGALGDAAVDRAPIDRPRTVAGVDGGTDLSAGVSGGLVVGPDGSVHVWGKYAVPDGKGGVVDNDTGAPQKLSWIIGRVAAATLPQDVYGAYAFLVR
jgi:hypothetical protein